jgi:hypothetical protein
MRDVILPEIAQKRKQRYILGSLDLDLGLWVWYDGVIRNYGCVRIEGKGDRVKASSDLVQVWRADPQAQVAVIVHVDGDPGQYVAAIEQRTLSVARTFRLTHTIAAYGPACGVLELLDQSWVTKVELDQKVTTM